MLFAGIRRSHHLPRKPQQIENINASSIFLNQTKIISRPIKWNQALYSIIGE
jgi:hypothetical protein